MDVRERSRRLRRRISMADADGSTDPIDGESTSVTEDEWRWEAEATQLRHEALTNIRKSAEHWSVTVTALVGIFGATSFIVGPQQLADVGDPVWRTVALVAVLLAIVATACAAVLAALAAQGVPRSIDILDGAALREQTRLGVMRASERLTRSRLTAVVGLMSILVATGVVVFAGAGGGKAQMIVRFQDGGVSCGVATKADDGALLLNGRRLVRVEQFAVVENCP